ncbi:hypothetical protein [Streptomyces halstedii]|uniref:hypothetical protein n=1 Tax=Streptomyces halstedii TaxID=1944 RepID=UPI0036B27064
MPGPRPDRAGRRGFAGTYGVRRARGHEEEFRETVLDSGSEDVGLAPGTPLFPVAVDADRSEGIFLIDAAGQAEERFWWTGEGNSFFFERFADVLAFLHDPGSRAPGETLLP